jgi:methionyl-tRNA formyltransferase
MCCSLDLEGVKLKLVASRLLPEDYIPPEIPEIGKPVSFEKTNKLIIRCGKGFLRLTQIVPESSREMSDENFIRGYRKLSIRHTSTS